MGAVDEASVRILSARWEHELVELASRTQNEFLLVSPYLTLSATTRVVNALPSGNVALTCLTDLSPRVLLKATHTEALRLLASRGILYHLPGLHAKVYVGDGAGAIVTSGNLTEGGIRTNFEMGVHLTNPRAVADVRASIQRYLQFARQLRPEDFSRYLDEIDRALEGGSSSSMSPAVTGAYREAIGRYAMHLRFRRVVGRQEGRLRLMFKEAILAELSVHGPQPLERLYDVVEARYPDFCDDAITRGRPPRPLWRHELRFALEELKEDQKIERDPVPGKKSGLWKVVPEREREARAW